MKFPGELAMQCCDRLAVTRDTRLEKPVFSCCGRAIINVFRVIHALIYALVPKDNGGSCRGDFMAFAVSGLVCSYLILFTL